MIKLQYKNYSNINNSNYMELDYKFMKLLKLVKQCHKSASWGDDVFVEKLISSVENLYNAFEKKFLAVAGDGKKWKEFETMTNKIFEKFGFQLSNHL